MIKTKNIFIILLLLLSLVACTTNDFENSRKTIEMIDNIGDVSVLTLEDEQKVLDARATYEALTSEEKTRVTNIKKLVSFEEKISLLKLQKSANEVVSVIENLPSVEEVTLEDKLEVETTRHMFDELSNEAKEFVSNIDKLINLENQIIELERQLETETKAKNDALALDNLVDELPEASELSLDDKTQLDLVRESYNLLSDLAKTFVTKLEKLNALEEKMNQLVEEHAADLLARENAQVVVQMISELPNSSELKYEHQDVLIETRQAYNALNGKAKSYVTNLSKLQTLESKMISLVEEHNADVAARAAALTVVNAIEALPSVETISLADEANVLNVRSSYNALNNKAKTYVTNLSKLTSLESKIAELKSLLVDYSVKLYPNQGRINGLTLETVSGETTVYEFVLNSYSTNFFNVYQTEVFVFKTTLDSGASSYAYNHKIGFSFDSNKGYYVVEQIVPEGTGLNESNRTSDYYIIINAENTAHYSSLLGVQLGDKITTTVEFPLEANESLNANINISRLSEVPGEYYQITLNNSQPIPTPIRTGYEFAGWFNNAECSGNPITTINENCTLFAKWNEDETEFDPNDIMSCVSNVATSNTVDTLPSSSNGISYVWSSSNPSLYVIKNGQGTVSKMNQTHKAQTVTITAVGTNPDKTTFSKTKEITVNPVLFEDLPSTPVATYFSVGAAYSYKNYSSRYKSEGTMFSSKAKETLDIVYWGFATFNSSGVVTVNGLEYKDEVFQLKNENARIVLCINGVSRESCQNFMDITADNTRRANFVKNLMDTVETYNFDGIDIDWESISSSVRVVASGMNALMKDLREEMTRRQDEGGTPYFLSAAVPASSWGTTSDRFDFVTLNKYVDYINVMSYDMNKTDITSHLSPLYKSSFDNGYGFGCAYGVERLTSLGLSRNKIIIGSAGYGKAFKVTGTSTSSYPGLGVSGSLTRIGSMAGSFDSGTVFGNVIEQLQKSSSYVKYLEYNNSNQLVASYLYNPTEKIFVSYDSSEMIKAKYNYAKSMNGVGIMCWCYTEDTTDNYINSIFEEMHK